MILTTITSPSAAYPDHLLYLQARVEPDAPDAELLNEHYRQAFRYAEQMLKMSLTPCTLAVRFDEGEPLHLPRGPVTEVMHVRDDAGNDIAYEQHRVGNSDRIRTQSRCPVTVTYKAGFAEGELPADIAGAIRVHAATLWAWREDKTAAAANTVHRLDDFYRWRGAGSLVT
jgi:hypothetical protein